MDDLVWAFIYFVLLLASCGLLALMAETTRPHPKKPRSRGGQNA